MMDFAILENLQRNWAEHNPEQLLTLGMAWRGIGGHPGIDSKARIGKQELQKAREMQVPVSVHASSPGIMAKLAEEGLLGSDMQLVHGMGASKETIAAMVASGASISISPYSELRIGYGFPPIPDFLETGATIGLSIDTTTLTGNADMFAVMKIFLNLANAMNEDEFSLSARQVLEFATLGGARSLGIADRTGSLTPGKRADLIMVNTRVPNMGFITNAADLIVEAAQPANVHTVLVDGRILKQNGRLMAVQEAEVYDGAAAALEGLKKRAD
jgi:5-methylthioadenosine/S-adenosylhomocysteine deaminase